MYLCPQTVCSSRGSCNPDVRTTQEDTSLPFYRGEKREVPRAKRFVQGRQGRHTSVKTRFGASCLLGQRPRCKGPCSLDGGRVLEWCGGDVNGDRSSTAPRPLREDNPSPSCLSHGPNGTKEWPNPHNCCIRRCLSRREAKKYLRCQGGADL